MPTTRPRYTVTETEELDRVLMTALRRWPDLRGDRPAALRRLIEMGGRELVQDADASLARRRAALQAVSGIATGMYATDEVDTLHAEWPE